MTAGVDTAQRIAGYKAWLDTVEWVADPAWTIARPMPAELGPEDVPDASAAAARLLAEGMAESRNGEPRQSATQVRMLERALVTPEDEKRLAKDRRQGPSREARRAALKRQRKANQKAAAHDCVLAQAARRYHVRVQVEAGAEQHRLHIAMGETWCSACSACKSLRAAKKPATVLSDAEVDTLLDYWEIKVDQARGAPEAKKRVAARKAFEATVFGGGRG
jgi:hypothetical protein